MVFTAFRGLTNGLQSPALERHVNLALSTTVGSLGPSACLLIWSFYKVVVVVGVETRTVEVDDRWWSKVISAWTGRAYCLAD